MQWNIMQRLGRQPVRLGVAEPSRRFGAKWPGPVGTRIAALLIVVAFAPRVLTQTITTGSTDGALIPPGNGVYSRAAGTNSVAVAGVGVGDGRIVAVGASQDNPSAPPNMAYLRVQQNGPPDVTHGTGGWQLGTTGPNNASFVNAVYLDTLGRTVGAGGSYDLFAGTYQGVVEIRDSTGALVWQRLLQIGSNRVTIVNAIVGAPDGSTFWAGVTSPDLNPANFLNVLGHLRADGSDDTTCNGTGNVTDNSGTGVQDFVMDFVDTGLHVFYLSARAQDNRISVVSRNLADCQLNTGWGQGGVATTDFGGLFNQPNGLARDPLGNVYIVGNAIDSSGSSTAAVRQLDSTGANGWLWNNTWGTFLGTANSISCATSCDGSEAGGLIIGGEAFSGQESLTAVASLKTVDGSLNTNYGTDGTGFVLTSLGAGTRAGIYKIANSVDGSSQTIGIGVAYPPPPDNNGRVLIQKYSAIGIAVSDFTFNGWSGP